MSEIVKSGYDVVILGSGMGGATFAHALRDSGLKLLIVERGDFLPKEPENWDAEAIFGKGRYRNAEAWLDGHGGGRFQPGVFYYVGGNTKFYGAMLPRFREVDFAEIEHAEGTSPAWPISYADLEPWYLAAEKLYHVHGTAGSDPTDPWRSGDYPWPGLTHDKALHRLEASLRGDGLHPFPMPAGVDYGANRPCILCPTCDGFPCKIDAKCDAELSALRPALKDGSLELLTRTKIERLETSEDGTRIVAAIGKIDGQSVRIEARHFILACGAVNSTALLLRSANRQHDRGLANSSDMVGRNYMVHNSTFMLAVDPREVNKVSFQKTLAINDWYTASPDAPYPLGNVQMLGKIRQQMVSGMKPWVPKFVGRYITDHSVDLYLTSEDLPDRENRVVWDTEKQAITIFWRPNNLSAHHGLVSMTTKAMRRAGYPFILKERMGIATNSHQCGTALMGTSASSSVLNLECRTHDIANLWLTDSSFFPSSAAVNPALTIAANAMRVAAFVRQSLKP